MVLAVAPPWVSASSYLSSQSLADSRCNPHATPRSSYSRRSPSCRYPKLGLRRGQLLFEGKDAMRRRFSLGESRSATA